jgi:hypothetical protein
MSNDKHTRKIAVIGNEMGIKSNRAMLGLLGMGMMLSGATDPEMMDYMNREHKPKNKQPYKPRPTPPPNGTNEYFFNSLGEYSTKSMLRTDVVFKCVASNDKNAIRKFCNHSGLKPNQCKPLIP